jgi:hypothetical protein
MTNFRRKNTIILSFNSERFSGRIYTITILG